ncbi:hypothetical protein GCM10009824_27720 [Kocuria atrinae]|uniref:Uncharacterized protein n=1 Tax=Kocuria atrinae TaxID=592377 RepID=A0ABP5JYB1_9MICC
MDARTATVYIRHGTAHMQSPMAATLKTARTSRARAPTANAVAVGAARRKNNGNATTAAHQMLFPASIAPAVRKTREKMIPPPMSRALLMWG